MKTLTFEPAGADTNISNIGNHRIRTRFLNNDNKTIYLEIEVIKPNYPRRQSKKQKALNLNAKWFVSHCYEENNESSGFRKFERPRDNEANWFNVIQWVNENLNCSFTDGGLDETLRIHEKLPHGGLLVIR